MLLGIRQSSMTLSFFVFVMPWVGGKELLLGIMFWGLVVSWSVGFGREGRRRSRGESYLFFRSFFVSCLRLALFFLSLRLLFSSFFFLLGFYTAFSASACMVDGHLATNRGRIGQPGFLVMPEAEGLCVFAREPQLLIICTRICWLVHEEDFLNLCFISCGIPTGYF